MDDKALDDLRSKYYAAALKANRLLEAIENYLVYGDRSDLIDAYHREKGAPNDFIHEGERR